MNELRYSWRALGADLARSGAGVAVTGTPLMLARPPTWLAAVLGFALALFLGHLASVALRARQRFRIDERGVQVSPAGHRIDWERLEALHLDYFSTRRDGRKGWMQLRLRAGGDRVRVDSGLTGFEVLLDRAVRAARARGLDLSAATAANIAAAQAPAQRPLR